MNQGQDGELEALTAELVEVQDRLVALYDLARTMRGFLEPAPLLEALTTEAIRLVGAEAGFAMLTYEGESPLLAASGGLPLDSGALASLVNGSGGPPARTEQRLTVVGRLLLVPVPLHSKGSALLVLVRPREARFMAPDERLAEAIASHAGSQLDGVLLHQESLRRTRLELEFELARSIQTGLTPSVPVACTGLDVHAESRPSSIVGGDFYDFVAADHDRLLCTFGDVAGKGIPAAMLVAMTRAAVRAAARVAACRAPAGVLARANADLQSDYNRLSLFATVLFGCFDVSAGRLTLANAGHSPVIYRPAQGGARLIRADAPPLGVLDQWTGSDLVLRLRPGDALIAATDGFSEAERGPGDLFGYDRLLSLTERTAGLPAAEAAAAFFAAIDEFSGGPDAAGDDQTLLVVRCIDRPG